MQKQYKIGDIVKAKLGATAVLALVVGKTFNEEFVVAMQLMERRDRVLGADEIPVTDKYYYNKKQGFFSARTYSIESFVGSTVVPEDIRREIVRIFQIETSITFDYKGFDELNEILSCIEKLQDAVRDYVRCAEQVSDALDSTIISRGIEELLGEDAVSAKQKLVEKAEKVRSDKLEELRSFFEPLLSAMEVPVSDDEILDDLREGTSIASVASKYKVAITRVRALNRVVTTEKAKQRLEERNIAIYKKAEAGVSYSELAVEYSLATRTIKQIVKAIRKLMETSEAEESVA